MSAVVSKNAPLQPFADVQGAKPAPYPGFIEFCDPTLRERAPAGADWVHEIKVDGYRAQIHIRDGKVIAYSRSGYDWTEQFAAVGTLASQRSRPIAATIGDRPKTTLNEANLSVARASSCGVHSAHDSSLEVATNKFGGSVRKSATRSTLALMDREMYLAEDHRSQSPQCS